MKILKKEKSGLEIWRIGSYPQNLVWIHAAVSEKPEFTDDGRTTDACAMTVALLTKSSRAKKDTNFEKSSELAIIPLPPPTVEPTSH